MAQTVVGLFETPAEAQHVKQELVSEGYAPGNIRIMSNETDGFAEAAVSQVRTGESHETGFMASVKNFFHSLGSDSKDQEYYTQGVSRGGALLAVDVPEQKVADVVSLLESHGAEDINHEATHAATPQTATAGTAGVIPIVEEEMQIGKRQVQRGGIRVYSRVVETPVEEDIRLREEHIRVDRVPVNRPASEADFKAFKEGTVELTETAEEAVIAKQARVVEEVKVGKEVTERTQTVKDTLRHTEVEVEGLPASKH